MAKRGKSASNKGHQFERDIANEFREIGWPKALRNLEYQSEQAVFGADLIHTQPFRVQTKAKKDYVSVSTILEVKDEEGVIPLLITKGDWKEPMAVIRWIDLKPLLKILKSKNLI